MHGDSLGLIVNTKTRLQLCDMTTAVNLYY